MLVRDIMSKRLVMLMPQETAYAAVKLMVENNISGVVVEEGKKAVGIVTLKDVARRVIAEGRDVHRTYVSDIMSAPVVTINYISMVENAAKLMGEKRLKRLVVVDDKNRAVGIITAMDVISNLPNLVEVMFKTWVKPDWR